MGSKQETNSCRKTKSRSLVHRLRGEHHVRLNPFAIRSNLDRAEKLATFSKHADAAKVERNALGAYFLPEAWEYVQKARQKLIEEGAPLGLGRKSSIIDNKRQQDTESVTTSIEISRSFPLDSYLLFDGVIQKGITDWWQFRRSTLDEDYSAYSRFRDILENRQFTPDTYYMRGIGTALDTMLGVLLVIPEVFKNQFGRDVSRDELSEIAENSLKLIMTLAAGNISGSIPVLAKMGLDARFDQYGAMRFTPVPKYFNISDKEGRQSLELNEKRIKKMRKRYEGRVLKEKYESVTTGCIAIPAEFEDKNIIRSMWEDWVLPAASEYYFPAFPDQVEDLRRKRFTLFSMHGGKAA